MHHAAHSAGARRLEQIPSALDVAAVELGRVAHAQPVVGGAVEESLAAGQRHLEALAVAQIADHEIDLEPVEVGQVAVTTHQAAHAGAIREQRPHDVRADETCAAGDQSLQRHFPAAAACRRLAAPPPTGVLTR